MVPRREHSLSAVIALYPLQCSYINELVTSYYMLIRTSKGISELLIMGYENEGRGE
jgi:hypothetical protein